MRKLADSPMFVTGDHSVAFQNEATVPTANPYVLKLSLVVSVLDLGHLQISMLIGALSEFTRSEYLV